MHKRLQADQEATYVRAKRPRKIDPVSSEIAISDSREYATQHRQAHHLEFRSRKWRVIITFNSFRNIAIRAIALLADQDFVIFKES